MLRKSGIVLLENLNDFTPKKTFILGWWSAGITSAVACKIALELYKDVELFYIHIDSAHPDNERFKKDCEKWYGKKIHSLKSGLYKDQFEAIEHIGQINSPTGAACTQVLKKDVRFAFEKLCSKPRRYIKNQVWGFDFSVHEVNRAIRLSQQYPNINPLFPLIEKQLTKDQCAGLLLSNGIELPFLYSLGFDHNNCVGCVKGKKGYWNKVRVHFPDFFNRMAKLERVTGRTCINGTYLDELEPDKGYSMKEVMPTCDVICDVELADLPDINLDKVLNGEIDIYEAVRLSNQRRKQTFFRTKNKKK